MDEDIIINLNEIVCIKDANDLLAKETISANSNIDDNKQENQNTIDTQSTTDDDAIKSKKESSDSDASDEPPTLINPKDFYNNAETYWSKIEPTVDGMLGGFASINSVDIRGSINFLQDLFKLKPAPSRRYALDCGAGIGRVTKQLLLPYFEQIDLVEQNEQFTKQIPSYVNSKEKIGHIYTEGLQNFTPTPGKYDLIWSQWVLGHLTDEDLQEFFQRCIKGLNKNGIMVIKENVTFADDVCVDKVDSSVTRPMIMLKHLMVKSGMRIFKFTRQNNFPSELFPVYIFAIKGNRTR